MEQAIFEERKKEILSKIFLTPEQALERKTEELKAKEKELESKEIILKQLKENTDNADMIIGDLFREFENKNPCSKETKDYNTRLWQFMSSEAIKRFSSAYEIYRKIEENKVKTIQKYKEKVQEYKKKLEEEENKLRTNGGSQ